MKREPVLEDTVVEEWASNPRGDRLTQIGVGLLVAFALVVYGAIGAFRSSTLLPGDDVVADIHGADAVFLSLAYVSLGFFLHFHFFWGLSDRLMRYSALGKLISVTLFVPLIFRAVFGIILSNFS